jgi:hypothetical protein
MSVFDLAVLLAALCGLVMVCGGIALLWRGAITLASTKARDAISIEFRKQFRIHTQIPGIAIFLVGLLFITQALYFSKPTEVAPIDLQGVIKEVAAPVTVIVSTKWPLPTFTDGQIRGRIYPDVSTLVVEATAPGYMPFSAPVRPKSDHVASIGEVRLIKKVEEIPTRPENIQPLDFVPPPPTKPGSFGAPR